MQTVTLRETVDSGLEFSLGGTGCTTAVDFRLRAAGGASLADDITLSINAVQVDIAANLDEYMGTLPCNQPFTLEIVDDDLLEEGERLSLELGDAETSFFPSAQYDINLVDPRGRLVVERLSAGLTRGNVGVGAFNFGDGLLMPEDGSEAARYRFSAELEGIAAGALAPIDMLVFVQGIGTSLISGQPDFALAPSFITQPPGWTIEERVSGSLGLTRFTIPLGINGPAQEIAVTGVMDNLGGEAQEGVMVYVPRALTFGGGDFVFSIDEAEFPSGNDGLGFVQPDRFDMPVPAVIDAIQIDDAGVPSTVYEQRMEVSWNDRGDDRPTPAVYLRETSAALPGATPGRTEICLEMTGLIIGSIRPEDLGDVNVRIAIDQRAGVGEATLNDDYTVTFDGGLLGTETIITLGTSDDYVERNNAAGITSSVFPAPTEPVCLNVVAQLDDEAEGYERIRFRLASAQPAGGVNLLNAAFDPLEGPGSARSVILDVYIVDLPAVSIVQVDGSDRRITSVDQDPIELGIAAATIESLWFRVDPPAPRTFNLRLERVIVSGIAPWNFRDDITVTAGTVGRTTAQDSAAVASGIAYPVIDSSLFAVDVVLQAGANELDVNVPAGTGLFSIMLQGTSNDGTEGDVTIDRQTQNLNSGYGTLAAPFDRRRVRIVP